MSIIHEIATFVEVYGELDLIEADPDDNIILESAIVGKANYLISGDDHLLKIKKYKDIEIKTVSSLLDLVGMLSSEEADELNEAVKDIRGRSRR